MSLRISKTPTDWRWYLEDMDAAADVALYASSLVGYPTWRACEGAARAAHPTVERVWIHAVRGTGVEYEDSLPSFPL